MEGQYYSNPKSAFAPTHIRLCTLHEVFKIKTKLSFSPGRGLMRTREYSRQVLRPVPPPVHDQHPAVPGQGAALPAGAGAALGEEALLGVASVVAQQLAELRYQGKVNV